MLPHKKNSDVAELARGKSGRLIGNLTGLLVILKGLPLTYNRDLQEDKEPLFDSVRQVLLVLRALRGAYDSLSFHSAVAAAAAEDDLLVAIDIAEELVGEGVPFRQAHERVGHWVAMAVADGATLREVVMAEPDAEPLRAPLRSGRRPWPDAARRGRAGPHGSRRAARASSRSPTRARRALDSSDARVTAGDQVGDVQQTGANLQ